MNTAFFRYFLALIVLVSLTSAPLCIDTQCSTEAESCCSPADIDVSCVPDCDDEHGAADNSENHCASCSQCSVSVITSAHLVEEQIVTTPLPAKILIERTSTGWVSLPERPPSA